MASTAARAFRHAIIVLRITVPGPLLLWQHRSSLADVEVSYYAAQTANDGGCYFSAPAQAGAIPTTPHPHPQRDLVDLLTAHLEHSIQDQGILSSVICCLSPTPILTATHQQQACSTITLDQPICCSWLDALSCATLLAHTPIIYSAPPGLSICLLLVPICLTLLFLLTCPAAALLVSWISFNTASILFLL